MQCSMSILYMQRQGKVSWKEWLIGSSIYALSAGILIGTAVLDGVPFRKYFHQVFQQYTGTTPAKFQQNN